MGHKNRKKNKKPKMYVDEFGRTHLVIDVKYHRNEMHFEVQRNTRASVIENKKYKNQNIKEKSLTEIKNILDLMSHLC